ncbi:hypothetical protein ARHIZOSPH14_21770 [Agromyces rhizosphaerae]|uniref:Uncharacterized protein n=1 Tax=Agromyces rhizosphaerae TaxID=88374 RepID=A0A9W6CYD7_9MICO|nr:hypothetical protein [Agromyces rhizosphaerae]GLI27935.1 hypothetical protein ARHIZOSPH14_21770 [Agromyces rhizosphaerae]
MSDTTPGSRPEDEPTSTPQADTGETDTTTGADAAPADAAPASEPPAPPAPPAETPQESDTSELDAAVQRAQADHPAPAAEAAEEPAAEAEAPQSEETPAAEESEAPTERMPAADEAPTTEPPAPVAPAAPAPPESEQQRAIYVQAPTPPRAKGNRGFGVLVGLIATVAFAALYALAGYLLVFVQGSTAEPVDAFVQFLGHPAFWVPVLVFFLAFILLAAIVNRNGWWAYAVFGLLVGIVVYFSYVGGALVGEAWNLTPAEVGDFVAARWLDPRAILAGVFAREVTLWFGAWVAARGRTVTARNRAAVEEYDRQLQAGPQLSRP